jgi:hypothetical protein
MGKNLKNKKFRNFVKDFREFDITFYCRRSYIRVKISVIFNNSKKTSLIREDPISVKIYGTL